MQFEFAGQNYPRWSDQFLKVKQSEKEYSARDDVFIQSVRSRLLNLLTGKIFLIPQIIFSDLLFF